MKDENFALAVLLRQNLKERSCVTPNVDRLEFDLQLWRLTRQTDQEPWDEFFLGDFPLFIDILNRAVRHCKIVDRS